MEYTIGNFGVARCADAYLQRCYPNYRFQVRGACGQGNELMAGTVVL